MKIKILKKPKFPSWLNNRAVASGALLVAGGLALALTACLPAVGPTPQTPTMIPEFLEPTATPEPIAKPTATPEPTPIPLEISDFLDVQYSDNFNFSENTRDVSFLFSTPEGYTLDTLSLFDSANDITVTFNSSETSTQTLSPANYVLSFSVIDEQGERSLFTQEISIPPMTESDYEAEVGRATDIFLTTMRPFFIDESQVDVLSSELRAFSRQQRLFARNEDGSFSIDYFEFLNKLQTHVVSSGMQEGYTVHEAAEEVKRALVATNVLHKFPDAGNPNVDDFFSGLEWYKEHRANNVDSLTGVAFSDPTAFNSVFDISVLYHFLSSTDEGSEARVSLLEESEDARTVAIGVADKLGFLFFPRTGLAEVAPWVKEAGVTPLEASIFPGPYALTASSDFRRNLWPVFSDKKEVARSNHGLGTGDSTLYYSLGAERWQVLEQLDVRPTAGAELIDVLAKGNVNESNISYDFNRLGNPTTIGESIFNLGTIALSSLDTLLPHRELLASFDVRTRGYLGNQGRVYGILREGTSSKERLIGSFMLPISGGNSAFRALGVVNPFAREDDASDYPIITYPGMIGSTIEKEQVLLQAGGGLWRASVDADDVREAQYDPEAFGVLCVAPGSITYPNSVIGNSAVYKNGECIAAGETWAVPTGVQLHESLSETASFRRSLYDPTLEAPPFPNSATAPYPSFPFFDAEESSRRFLFGFDEQGNSKFPNGRPIGNDVYGNSPTFLAKYFFFKLPEFDEGTHALPEVERGSLEHIRGPYKLVVDTVSPISVAPDYTATLER